MATFSLTKTFLLDGLPHATAPAMRLVYTALATIPQGAIELAPFSLAATDVITKSGPAYQQLHRELARHRVNGEWFYKDPALLAVLNLGK